MDIKTKYNIEDEVWVFVRKNEIEEDKKCPCCGLWKKEDEKEIVVPNKAVVKEIRIDMADWCPGIVINYCVEMVCDEEEVAQKDYLRYIEGFVFHTEKECRNDMNAYRSILDGYIG